MAAAVGSPAATEHAMISAYTKRATLDYIERDEPRAYMPSISIVHET